MWLYFQAMVELLNINITESGATTLAFNSSKSVALTSTTYQCRTFSKYVLGTSGSLEGLRPMRQWKEHLNGHLAFNHLQFRKVSFLNRSPKWTTFIFG